MSSTPEYKQCPDCAEQVLAPARKCRYCGYRFDGGRKRRPSLLSDLIPGLRRDTRDTTLPEVLADWGVSIGDTEEIALFRLVKVDDRPGYLLVTSERLVFFGQVSRGEHERALEYRLNTLTEVIVRGGRLRRRLELRGLDFWHAVQGAGSADVEWLGDYLARQRLER
jgi:Uncharacterised protein family UPF0547